MTKLLVGRRGKSVANPENAPSSEAIINLINGKTLSELESLRDETAQGLEDTNKLVERLQSDSKEVVIQALREIMALGQEAIHDTPGLQTFKSLARPSHHHAPLITAALKADVPIWLHGEAGSGKSTSSSQVAEALELPFRAISLGPTTSKSDLLGYRDATGNYHDTGFRRIYEDGGIFLFDEIDNAHPSILTLLNSALANGHGEFPDGRIERHAKTRFIASANTIGKGATSEYVGRAPIDAATTDRFAYIPFDTDPALEEALILGESIERDELDISAGEVPSDREWLAIVRANRDAVAELGIRALVSQRAAIYGKRLAAQGVGKQWLHEMLIYKGMKSHDREKLEAKARELVRSVRTSSGKNLLQINRAPEAEQTDFTEPSDTLEVPEALMILLRMGDLPDRFTDRALDETAWTTLCWHLEKAIPGIDLYRSSNFLAQVVAEKYHKSTTPTVREITSEATTHRRLHPMQPQEYDLGESSVHDRRFAYTLDRLGISLSVPIAMTYSNEFKKEIGYVPGPVSLAYWLETTGREARRNTNKTSPEFKAKIFQQRRSHPYESH